MFTLSHDAVQAIRDLSTMPDAPAGASLRISAGNTAETLRLSLAGQPHPGDEVHEAAEQLQVFVAPEATALLDGKTLDARTNDTGRVEFVLDSPPR
ncbi:MAG: Fe-S cluster assembly protein HesB [Actinomycetota bacterium]|nr:Fe-S cluster assembly protein HesB [Actinomycetota bacterium]